MRAPFVYFENQLAKDGPVRRTYRDPREIITAHTAEEARAALARIETVRATGFHLAGWCAYELGYVLEPVLQRCLPKKLRTPLLCFGVFSGYNEEPLPRHGEAKINTMSPAWSLAEYEQRFRKIADFIKAGDVYQINLSFPLSGKFEGSLVDLYALLSAQQPVAYGGICALGSGPDIVTISPELFFAQNGDEILMRPMKGTAARGDTPAQDKRRKAALHNDEKNRAENLMIVDLLRNDLSRLAQPGGVKVTDLFSVETYPHLYTMTSGIAAKCAAPPRLEELLRAMFPCGSITGAPKIRAMEIIHTLEPEMRGPYCGAVGYIEPGNHAQFNVAIRTLEIADDTYRLPVGSGIVHDSQAASEYEECLLKGTFLLSGPFELIETMGWHEQTGFMHLDLHMARLRRAAKKHKFALSENTVSKALEKSMREKSGPHRVRLMLASDGKMQIDAAPFRPENPSAVWPVSLCKTALYSTDPLRRYKTSRRAIYSGERARLAAQTGCREILFLNEKEEVCEGSFTNIFAQLDGQIYTPPVQAGLLPGILRQVLIANGTVKTRSFSLDDLQRAEAIYVGNSLRGLIRAEITSWVRA